MATECLVVCDAWKEPLPHDAQDFPHLADETKAFGVYLISKRDLINLSV